MRKIMIILILLSFTWGISQTASAQMDNASQKKVPVKMGMRISPCISWMTPETKHYSYNGITGGVAAGLVADIYFARNYAFSTGFNFSFLNGKLDFGDTLNLNNQDKFGTFDRKYKFIYLDIPYLIKMQTNPFGKFSFFGQIGFSTGFRMSAKISDHFTPEDGSAPYEGKSDYANWTTLIRQAVLFGVGMEFHIDHSTRLFFGVNYSQGLNNVLTGINIASDLNEKALLNFAELNLGVLF